MADGFNSFMQNPALMAALMGGVNMMAASRGGSTDLSKGGLGYALQQGLQGGLQGAQMAGQFSDADLARQEAAKKKSALDDMLMKLNMTPQAQGSVGVLRPEMQNNPFAKLPPDQRQMAALAIQNGDIQTAMKALYSPAGGGTGKGLDSFAPIYMQGKEGMVAGIPYLKPDGTAGLAPIPTTGQIMKETPWEARMLNMQADIATAGGKKNAENAAAASLDAMKQSRTVLANQPVYDEVLAALDAGANTGVIAQKFPSMFESSITLDNAAQRLGLGVISSATFGALSEAELKMAMSTALPKGLEGPALREWVMNKKAADAKAAAALEEAAIYLGEPGNTISSWLKLQREQRKQAEKANQSVGRFKVEVE